MGSPSAEAFPLYSVGHSNHPLPVFLGLLEGAGVTTVADVRSSPYSRRLPQFNRPELEQALRQRGLVYLYLGGELGGRPADLDLYDAEGRVDYERVRQTERFDRGLDALLQARRTHTVALLCGEADPLDCHRGLMIAPALVERGVLPLHLRRDGTAETTAEFEARLLAVTGVGNGMVDGLFAGLLTPEDRRHFLRDAYRARALQAAFRLPSERPTPAAPGEDVDADSW